jgi:hypothetical protein
MLSWGGSDYAMGIPVSGGSGNPRPLAAVAPPPNATAGIAKTKDLLPWLFAPGR